MQISTQKYMQNRSINEKVMVKGQDLSTDGQFASNQMCYRTWGDNDPLLVYTAESSVRQTKNSRHKKNDSGKY